MIENDATQATPVDYGRFNRPRRRWMIWIIAVLIVLSLVALTLAPSTSPSRPVANQPKCSNNLRQIGQAVAHFAKGHHGRYPNTLMELYQDGTLDPSVFVCTATNDSAASGPTTQAICDELTDGGHLSYRYLGRGLTSATVTPNTVVVLEPFENHHNGGINVLFGDGHVAWIQGMPAAAILARAAAGLFPTSMP